MPSDYEMMLAFRAAEYERKSKQAAARREAEYRDTWAMHRFVGKCRRCKAPISVLAQMTKIGESPWQVYMTDTGERLKTSNLTQGPIVVCKSCGGPVHPKEVRGVYKASEACGAKCQNATGPSCECSCKGMNHGRGHA